MLQVNGASEAVFDRSAPLWSDDADSSVTPEIRPAAAPMPPMSRPLQVYYRNGTFLCRRLKANSFRWFLSPDEE